MRVITFTLMLVFILLIAGCVTDAEKTAKKKAKEKDAKTKIPGVKTPGSEAEVKPCEDTDAGNNIYRRGKVTLFNEQGSKIGETTDTCRGSTVVQYNCPAEGATIDDKIVLPSAEFNCANGCENGMCIPTRTTGTEGVRRSCDDPDNGMNPREAVYSTGSENGQTVESGSDTCIDTRTVREYYCELDRLRQTDIPCRDNEQCNDGRCVELLPTCSDSDNGNNVNSAGSTEVRRGDEVLQSGSDTCVNANTIREYYCQGDQLAQAEVACGQGSSCANGACQQAAPTCVDSDGNDPNTVGNVVSGATTRNDVCTGQQRTIDGIRYYEQVREHYCEGGQYGQWRSADTQCAAGKVCQDGRCIPVQAGLCPFANTPCSDQSKRCDNNYRCVARQIGCVLDTNNIDVSIRAYASFYNGNGYEAIMENRDLREGQSYSHEWLDWVNSVIVRDITYTVGECTAVNVACSISNKRVVLEVDASGQNRDFTETKAGGETLYTDPVRRAFNDPITEYSDNIRVERINVNGQCQYTN